MFGRGCEYRRCADFEWWGGYAGGPTDSRRTYGRCDSALNSNTDHLISSGWVYMRGEWGAQNPSPASSSANPSNSSLLKGTQSLSVPIPSFLLSTI